jgi:hypothetical protein
LPSAVTFTCCAALVAFTFKVLSWFGSASLDNRSFPFQEGRFADARLPREAGY